MWLGLLAGVSTGGGLAMVNVGESLGRAPSSPDHAAITTATLWARIAQSASAGISRRAPAASPRPSERRSSTTSTVTVCPDQSTSDAAAGNAARILSALGQAASP